MKLSPSFTSLALAALACAACSKSSAEFVSPATSECDAAAVAPDTMRVVSYNIRGGLSSSIDEIGRVLEETDGDVIALQEVHKGVEKTDGVDQAKVLAERLGLHHTYVGAIEKDGGTQGVALLSRFPFQRVQRVDLDAALAMEPRTAIDASLCAGPRPIRVVTTHADFLPWSAEGHVKDLIDHIDAEVGKGLVVAGDLNALPTWAGPLALVGLGLVDLLAAHGDADAKTFIGDMLPRRLDYIFADQEVARSVFEAGVFPHIASDHLPIFADVDVVHEQVASAE